MPARIIIPNGTRFTKLVVVARHHRNNLRKDFYECLCDCGSIKVVLGHSLHSGNTKSCGCLQPDAVRQSVLTHGGSRTPEYKIWTSMKARCLNPRSQEYANYGARGITVCQEWQDSYEAFIRDVGPRPSPDHSIERKDNNANYEPGNVKWATDTEQTRNKRTNHLLTLNGETHCVTDWAQLLGMNPKTLSNRLLKGWPPEKALTTPINMLMKRR